MGGQASILSHKKLQNKNVLFCSMCCLVYFSSYVTRINYVAAISEIIVSLGITKSLASMAVTGSFITYGIGQVFSGIIGDRVKPRTMIFVGLLITSICNIIMATLSNVYAMTVVWCINGLAQSMLWPPLTRIMSENLSPSGYEKTCVAVSASASVATISIYLIVPLFITFSGWRFIFLFSAIWGIVVGILWLFTINTLTPSSNIADEIVLKPNASSLNYNTKIFKFVFILILIIAMFQGILRDGITTWMPSYLNDVYHFGTSISILSTAILPVFSIVSVYIASYIHKLLKNELKANAFIWIVAFVSSFVLIFVFATKIIPSFIMMVIITASMHGINLMLVSVYPSRYKKIGRVSTISGIINAFIYGGSAIASYGIAALSDAFGWKITIITWCIIAFFGTILSIICTRKSNLTQIY